jgi:hypothetical protein
MDDWVNDQLHGIIGMSDKTLAQFMIALAKKVGAFTGNWQCLQPALAGWIGRRPN